jgi:hypothetical protein
MIRKIGSAGLIILGVIIGPPGSRAFDVQSATDELGQFLREDIQRQRARAQREDAELERRGVDLSEFGRLVDDPPARKAQRSAPSIQCTTINLVSWTRSSLHLIMRSPGHCRGRSARLIGECRLRIWSI